MLRFPNPSSTTNNFVSVYRAAYNQLYGQVIGLDDIVRVAVEANLGTSSGHVGSEAIRRSTHQDRSLDSLYNQFKMYAELFRDLGWLHPTKQRALRYTFTLLGSQIVAARQHYLPLLGETVVGISHPSHVATQRGDHDVRPFGLLLKTMLACQDCLARDEMIVGPLSITSDRMTDTVDRTANLVMSLRTDPAAIGRALKQLASSQGVQINTLKNYTRWPIAVMRDLRWTTKIRRNYPNSLRWFEVHQLTSEGKRVALLLVRSADLRLDQVSSLPFAEKAAISIHAHYGMLERSGFDVSQVRSTLAQHQPDFHRALRRFRIVREQEIIFSPFQSLSLDDISKIFPATHTIASQRDSASTKSESGIGRGPRDHLFVRPIFVEHSPSHDHDNMTKLRKELCTLETDHPSLVSASSAFVKQHQSDSQDTFYPLVVHLLRVLGIEAKTSREGANYQRWDACAYMDKLTAIPIEIKSPAEEEFLSTKAVRQALENKVILLARRSLKTSRPLSTIIVGFKIPNERGDMSLLIDDIYGAYGISIGVIDLHTLALLAIRSATEGITIDPHQLGSLRGFLHA